MLRFLRIEHLAVIDAVQVEFEPGLNVLTGETGAGKSMLVEAVGLLMGGRASADLIRTGESQAQVRRSSMSPTPKVGPTLIVRRDINAQGRSRAFLNDTLVTAAALSDAAAPLVELHGQHEHQTLLDPQSHLLMLDEFAGLVAARADVGAAFRAWKQLQSELDAFHMDEREKAARLDLLKFQMAEIAGREASRRRGRGARDDAPRAEQRRQAAAALRRRVRRAL